MTKQRKAFSALTAALVSCGLSFSAGADQLPNEGASFTIEQSKQLQAPAINIAGPASAAFVREDVADARLSVVDGNAAAWDRFVRDLERNNSGNYGD